MTATATAPTAPTAPPIDGAAEAALGIDPVPQRLRRLGALDICVLWGDLSVGILVIAAGALLVSPVFNFSLGPALAAIVIGTVAGSLLLALVAYAGHQRAVPTMVLLRPVLGHRGSYLATAVNVAQLIGWTAFELWAMALFANRVSDQVFGFTAFGLYLGIVAVACTALALLGPVGVIRAWLARFGIWIVLAACGYLTIYLMVRADWGSMFAARTANVPFAIGVDLVIALPVSWLPLVADFNRFCKDRRANFAGTFVGYSLGNIWFYTLGVLLVLGGGLTDASPAGIAAGILAFSGGAVIGTMLLVGLLAGETDEAFADIYGAAVSVQNAFPRISQRTLVVAVAAVSTALAAVVTMGTYEVFLFLLGSIFTALFGVLIAVWLTGGLADPKRDANGAGAPVRPAMIGAWLGGIAAFHWITPTGPSWWTDIVRDIPGAARFNALGGSLPSFAVSFAIAYLVGRAQRTASAITGGESEIRRVSDSPI